MENKIYSFEIEILKEEELDNEAKKTIEEAKKASQNSYAPYSRFQVGAAVVLSDGKIVQGNNQENIAYPSGLCAERVAVFSANAIYPKATIRTLAIAAQTGGNFTEKPITPCGACRQVLSETEQRQKAPIDIYLYGSKEILHIHSVADLLPLAFDF
ncbi:MAG: cytidine deaminase [Paludibacteraceae bacterium]|nr:cytidine deaminase [Paludibacteraceae bacterium]